MVRSVRAAVIILPTLLFAPLCRASGPLDTLQRAHPRLIFTDKDLAAVKGAVSSDAFAAQQYQELMNRGEALLSVPPDSFQLTGPEHTLLNTARDVEDRVITLAALYRMTGDRRFANRATQEMLAAAAYPSWYPAHFLDTAETTTALGIGYDWLYNTLSPADRQTIRQALVSKSLDPWLALIASGKAHYNNNWSQVCNGGETIGALAIADEEPAKAQQVIAYAQPSIKDIMRLFAPDGGFEEGPVYWSYATIYNVLYISALNSALGTDFGAADNPGFSLTPEYRLQGMGPSNLYANFGDSSTTPAPAPQMFWFALRFHHPAYAVLEKELETSLDGHMDAYTQKDSERFSPFGLFWAALDAGADRANAAASEPPLVQSFSRVNQAYLRTAWQDPTAWFVGFKGGDAKAGHAHLDLGSFVLDAAGQRWAIDLGADNYGLPGYFSQQRWGYYRIRTEGHNTLTIDGQSEDLDAKAPLTSVGANFAIADLQQAYKSKLQSWSRGIMFPSSQRMLVEDEVTPIGSSDIVWNLHTAASVTIVPDGRSAVLTQRGATIEARILSPAGCRFTTQTASVAPPQATNKGVTNLTIHLGRQSDPQRISVLFLRPDDRAQAPVKPLADWR